MRIFSLSNVSKLSSGTARFPEWFPSQAASELPVKYRDRWKGYCTVSFLMKVGT